MHCKEWWPCVARRVRNGVTTDPVATSDDTKRMGDWVGGAEFDCTLCSAQGGDEVAFAALWRSLHPPLLRWLSVVAPGGAEDVESEVWVTVTRGLASFEGDERDFRAWVFTTARRRAIDWARRRKREPRCRSSRRARRGGSGGHQLLAGGCRCSARSSADAAAATDPRPAGNRGVAGHRGADRGRDRDDRQQVRWCRPGPLSPRTADVGTAPRR